MDLQKHYNNLWEGALRQLKAGGVALDPFLDSEADDRFGITLLIRPGDEVKAAMQSLLLELRQLEPEQYFYPASDLHVTVMSVISCQEGFQLKDIELEEYISVIRACLAGTASFKLDFKGITASPSCLMVQGFPASGQLAALRNALRLCFNEITLKQSIDSRYVLQTAHSTIVRFRKPLRNPAAFLEKVQEHRTHFFGSTEVKEVEVVYNDWYQRQAKVRQLASFRLK